MCKACLIDGKTPDWININGQKLIIEYFGNHWHELSEEEERIKFFAKYGYRTLIIWASEFYRNKDLVKNKIKLFILGGK